MDYSRDGLEAQSEKLLCYKLTVRWPLPSASSGAYWVGSILITIYSWLDQIVYLLKVSPSFGLVVIKQILSQTSALRDMACDSAWPVLYTGSNDQGDMGSALISWQTKATSNWCLLQGSRNTTGLTKSVNKKMELWCWKRQKWRSMPSEWKWESHWWRPTKSIMGRRSLLRGGYGTG